MDFELITQEPRPVILVTIKPEEANTHLDWYEVCQGIESVDAGLSLNDALGSAFRGVAFKRLPVVMATGIDAEPSDREIYVDLFSKALEYGGWPKLMLLLDHDRMAWTTRRLTEDMSPEEVAELRRVYPGETKDHLGRTVLFRTQRGTLDAYDLSHGRWIPGDPMQVLKALLVIHHAADGMTDEEIRRDVLRHAEPRP